jgi:transcriptional regulator with XRE-family HTH domain
MKFIPAVISEYSTNTYDSMNHFEDLASYILRVCKEDNLSFNAIERRAKRKGFKISQGYISKIVSDAAANISVGKLRALAAGLNRPEEEVFAVARGQRLTDEKVNEAVMNSLAFNYGKLTKKDKEAVAPLLRALQREIDERLEKVRE